MISVTLSSSSIRGIFGHFFYHLQPNSVTKLKKPLKNVIKILKKRHFLDVGFSTDKFKQ